MRWHVFAIATYLALALELGLPPLVELRAWSMQPNPSVMLVLMVFIALMAPVQVALWAAAILGLLIDLTHPYPVVTNLQEMFDVAVPGPYAISYLVGAWAVLQLRSYTFKDSPVALAALVFFAGLFVSLIAVALLWLRGMPMHPGGALPDFQPSDELLVGFFNLLYTTAVAIPLGWLLIRSESIWGFEDD